MKKNNYEQILCYSCAINMNFRHEKVNCSPETHIFGNENTNFCPETHIFGNETTNCSPEIPNCGNEKANCSPEIPNCGNENANFCPDTHNFGNKNADFCPEIHLLVPMLLRWNAVLVAHASYSFLRRSAGTRMSSLSLKRGNEGELENELCRIFN
ncbi:MAG TPA: hypothetical protein ENL20_03660 [Candidatus Cloacimonetes bacterium]|nr:hypothetical protein [Candidatus Cloacimonadota bacterium]